MEAARETGVLTLVSEMSGLEGKRAAGSQALEPWAWGWEQAGVRSSASLRLLNPSGGGERGRWGGGPRGWGWGGRPDRDGGVSSSRVLIEVVLSFLNFNFKAPGILVKESGGSSFDCIVGGVGECWLGVLTVTVKKVMKIVVFR